MKTLINFASAVFYMVQGRSKPRFTIFAALSVLVVWIAARPVEGAELKQVTAQAFDHYVSASESRMQAEIRSGPFLHIDGLPAAQRSEAYRQLRAGQILLWNANAQAGGSPVSVPYGLIHDWSGAVFIPDVTLTQALAAAMDWNNLHAMYSNVRESRLIGREGNTFRVFLQLYQKSLVTVAFNAQFDMHVEELGDRRAVIWSHSTRIAEIADAGQTDAHDLPVDNGHGYLWRLNGYSRFEERDGGVYVQVESIALSRSVPFFVAWLVNPLLESIPRKTMLTGLTEMRTAVINEDKENSVAQSGIENPLAGR